MGDRGPYRLEAVLGAGGMGRVYLGRTPAGAAVAVKLVHREYAEDKAFRKRFEQEVATARRVHGLYTVPVVDADTNAEEPWLATAYVHGPSLQDAVEHGPLPAETAVRLIAGVAEALESIHAAGVIHRDLKPSNVILTAEGPKVIDFGIARAADLTSITGTGAMPGTPAYMAPEQILGHPITPAADIFALGTLTNFAATGHLAFAGESLPAVIHRILQQEPELDRCPEPLSSIATAAYTKTRGSGRHRPRSSDSVAKPGPHCRPPPGPPEHEKPRRSSRHRGRWPPRHLRSRISSRIRNPGIRRRPTRNGPRPPPASRSPRWSCARSRACGRYGAPSAGSSTRGAPSSTRCGGLPP